MNNLELVEGSAPNPKKVNIKALTYRPLLSERDLLFKKYSHKLRVNTDLDRTLVSFQANRTTPFFNWFKYREGFSSNLVRYIIENVSSRPGTLLDPFAGSGTALFEGAEQGWVTEGIELLPVGVFAIKARSASKRVNALKFKKAVEAVLREDFKKYYDEAFQFQHIPITENAFPKGAEKELVGYRSLINRKYKNNPDILTLLELGSFSILEEISFTRKDGQYLRWDHRSGRSSGKSQFDKGKIDKFREAISLKLNRISNDLLNIDSNPQQNLFMEKRSVLNNNYIEPILKQGSCLKILPQFKDGSVDLIITSPPYCNRYDYTRTYALELVYLDANADDVKSMRQDLLSCTVENREKVSQLREVYISLGKLEAFNHIYNVFNSQAALQEVLSLLDGLAAEDKLNNPNIAKMVRNYFFEMCFSLREMARILPPGGKLVMVNDNVQYAGEEVPVDLIICNFAESFGLKTNAIWVLPRGKGNSSQQMGDHGRTELRKCVYVLEKA